ncbi:hypothetical protein SAMN05519103_02581 [Rhizobiales bacterium GAS113]|nr:hypothetical protein SAMN05519103_02581 [Rhizobiales bacterium GAS113]
MCKSTGRGSRRIPDLRSTYRKRDRQRQLVETCGTGRWGGALTLTQRRCFGTCSRRCGLGS